MCCWTCCRTLMESHMKDKRCGPTSSLTLKMFWDVCVRPGRKEYCPGGETEEYRRLSQWLQPSITHAQCCDTSEFRIRIHHIISRLPPKRTGSLQGNFNIVQLEVSRRLQHFRSCNFLLHQRIRITQLLNITKSRKNSSNLCSGQPKACVPPHHWQSCDPSPYHSKITHYSKSRLCVWSVLFPLPVFLHIRCYKWFKCALQTSDLPTFPNVFWRWCGRWGRRHSSPH